MATSDALETLLARHKKEQKSLVARTTALKKSVTKGEKAKKKEVLAEIQRLEDALKSQHAKELAELQDSTVGSTASQPPSNDVTTHTSEQGSMPPMIQALSLNEESVPSKVESNGRGGKPKVNRQKARMVFAIPDCS
jgi:OTU domain-containing protein 6